MTSTVALNFKAFLPFDLRKVDEDLRMVWGYASTEAVDADGETIERAAIEKALGDYMQFANLREMHQLKAAGVVKEAEVDTKGLYIGAKVVDRDAWEKVKEGVYKGFSIGGRILERAGTVIKALTLDEISLVDRPANPEALIEVFKAMTPATDFKKPEPVPTDYKPTSPRAEEAMKALAAPTTAEPAAPAPAEVVEKVAPNEPWQAEWGIALVGEVANALVHLYSVCNAVAMHEASEGDTEEHVLLRQAVEVLANALVRMTADEARELLNTFASVEATTKNEFTEEQMEAISKEAALKAVQMLIAKAAGASPAATAATAPAPEAPAAAPAPAPEAPVEKANDNADLAKALEAQGAVLTEMARTIADLKAVLPAPAKGVLKAVSKGDDLGPEGGEPAPKTAADAIKAARTAVRQPA